MNKVCFLKLWSVGTGAMDAVTGLLLVFAPVTALRLLGIDPPPPDTLVFLNWIGIFVLAVGLSYGLALRGEGGETVWAFTALVRMLVAIFLTIKMAAGALETAWLAVALADGAVALVQIAILRMGWWKEGKP